MSQNDDARSRAEALSPEHAAALNRLSELLKLARWKMRQTRGSRPPGLETDDLVDSAFASGLNDPKAVMTELDDDNPVWAAMRRALDRKVYKHFEKRQETAVTDVADTGSNALIERLRSDRFGKEDLAECFAVGTEIFDRLDTHQRQLADLLLAQYSHQEIANELGTSQTSVRRQILKLRLALDPQFGVGGK